LTPLFLDNHLLVVDKPAGLLAVPGRGADKQDCLVSRLQAVWPDVLTVHRLDMATSGVMVFARNAATQAALSRQFAERQVYKRYVALVDGLLRQDERTLDDEGWSLIELPLAADWPRRPMQKVDEAAGKASATRWRVLGHDNGATRVALQPLTGRTHQLRVHLLALGHAIVGDALYADGAIAARSPRLLLHAQTLALAHPVTAEPLRIDSAPPF
jgi:tRNA pseudouridine32 synthase/23S rRNA pseudouridine746 synthase